MNPPSSCEWVNSLANAKYLIQDGLNTKSKTVTLMLRETIVEILKFEIFDDRLRGSTLRCALFCFVPYDIYLIPYSVLEHIANQYIEISRENYNKMDSPSLNNYILEQESHLNEQLKGSIGEGKRDHKKINLLGAIKGYTEFLLDEKAGGLNIQQKELLENISDAINSLLSLNVGEKNRELIA